MALPLRKLWESTGDTVFDAEVGELRRQTSFRWARQERLTRSIAQQAVGLGEGKISLKGAIFPNFKNGLKQSDTLRSVGC